MVIGDFKQLYLREIDDEYQAKMDRLLLERRCTRIGFISGWNKAMRMVKRHRLAGVDADAGGCVVFQDELRPAVKFLDQPLQTLLWKVIEECSEVVKAHEKGEGYERIAEELIDVQAACETALTKLPCTCTRAKRREKRLAVIEKNERRGYYKK